jgi:hypothetical protein
MFLRGRERGYKFKSANKAGEIFREQFLLSGCKCPGAGLSNLCTLPDWKVLLTLLVQDKSHCSGEGGECYKE